MSTNIDERIVEMKFENKQFENGVKTSIKSLDDLKKGLKLDESAKSLSNLEKAGKSFSLAGIAEGVSNISKKFEALGIIGITVLQRLTNSVINFGARITSAMTISPIKTGLEEYETKINAITTILTNTASKGTKLEDVNKALNELNEYADLTIYNFAEMTRNIGTFTAAGVDLKTSVTSIKGIANLAAGSGSSAQQAATAMYQLSQAIAAGSVKLMDWNSVVNAGMGGEMFQKALEKTALELGHGRNMAVSFRESLQDGWITTEVLTKTLEKFANDKSLIKAATQVKTFTQLLSTMSEAMQSGWAQTWENVIGNRDEAAAFFTAINDGFSASAGAAAKARNEMLAYWKANGGRDALIKGLSNALISMSLILEPIEKAFRDIFPPMTAKKLVEITKRIEELTSKFKIGEQTSKNLERTFKGLFALLDIGKQAITAMAKGLMSVLKYILPVGDGFISFTGSVGDFLVAIDQALKKTNFFAVALQKIGEILKPFADGIKNAVNIILGSFKSIGKADMSGVDSFTNKVEGKFKPFTALINFVVDTIKAIAPILYKFCGFIGDAFGRMTDGIAKAFENGQYKAAFDMLNEGLFAGILLGLNKFIKSLTQFTNNAGGYLGKVTGILDGVQNSLKAYQSNLKAGTLLKIAMAIGILATSLLVLSSIDPAKLTVAMAAMTGMFIDLFGAMTIFTKIMNGVGIKAMSSIVIATTAMITLSTAILILSAAMTRLAKLDWNGIVKGLASVGILSLELVGTAKLLNGGSKGLIRASIGFIAFSAAINILALAVGKLGSLNLPNLGKGLIGIGVLVTELALFMRGTDLSKMGIMKGLGLITLAASISILATAVGKFANLNIDGLIRGLGAVGIVLAELAAFIKLTGDSKRVISTAVGLTILSVAMNIFATAITKIGAMPINQIGKGLLGMGGALAIITTALNYMPKNMAATGTGLLIIASSLIVLSNALINMGAMTWDGISRGMVALAGSLTIIAVAMKFMKIALPGAAALLVVASALAVLAPVLKTLGSMSLPEIGKGLLALAGAFTVIGVAGLVLGPITPVLLALSAAVGLLGIGCLAAGGGLLAFSAGLAALTVSGAAGAAALIGIVKGLIDLIPTIIEKFGQGLLKLAKVIGDGAPIVAESFVRIVKAIIKTITTLVPDIVKGAVVLIGGFLQGIMNTVPKIIRTTVVVLSALLKGIVDFIPNLVDAGMKILIGFLKGISDNIPKVVKTAVDIVVNFIRAIGKETPRIVDAGFKMIVDFLNGIADAIRDNYKLVNDAIGNLVDAMIDAFAGTISQFVDAGKNLIQGLIDGIKSKITEAASWTKELGNQVIESARNALGIHSPSKIFAEIGKYVSEGLAKGIEENTPAPVEATKKASKKVVKAAKDSFEEFKKSIDERKYYNKLSLKEELELWERAEKKYATNAERRKEIDREVYRVKNELIKSSYDKSVKFIDDHKYYNQMSLMDELGAWKRIQQQYKVGSDEREKADKEIYRLQKEISNTNLEYGQRIREVAKQIAEEKIQLEQEYYDKSKEINDKLMADIQAVNDQYDEALRSRSEALYDSYGIFDSIEKRDPMNGELLTKNLQDQINEFDNWQKSISTLAKRGVDEGLIKELTDMGPKSAIEIQALSTMTDTQLTTYVGLWKTKHEQAKNEAISELESLRIESDSKIAQLRIDSETQLNEYTIMWNQKIQDLTRNAMEQINKLKDEWVSKVGSLKDESDLKFAEMVNSTKKIVNTPDWIVVGHNVVDGIIQGIKERQAALAAAASSVAKSAVNATNTTLKIKSPSRVFAEIGMYSILGFAKGLKDFANVATETASGVGTSAVNGLKETISNISSVIVDNVDPSPVIRPVLDLTNIEAGGKQINSILRSGKGINVSGVISKLPNMNKEGSTSDVKTSTQPSQGNSIQFVQNNYSPKELSRFDIYRQTKNQISTLKGLVSPA